MRRRTSILAVALLTVLVVGCVKTREVPVEQTIVVRETVVVIAQAGSEGFNVIRLATAQIAELGDLPTSMSDGTLGRPTRWVRCVEAIYRSGNQMWVVTCNFSVERGSNEADATRQYAFDDRTGKLAR